jgi:hypothetical protein
MKSCSTFSSLGNSCFVGLPTGVWAPCIDASSGWLCVIQVASALRRLAVRYFGLIFSIMLLGSQIDGGDAVLCFSSSLRCSNDDYSAKRIRDADNACAMKIEWKICTAEKHSIS